MNKIKGLVAAPFSVLDSRGELQLEKIPAYCEMLEKNKITGAFINGSTGEGVSLTHKEKMQTLEQWSNASNGKALKLINLVGGTSYKECIDSAIHSEKCGTDAIAILAPYYFKPPCAKALVDFCALIAESVPKMPVYFYHIPVLTGCHISMFDFLKEADSVIPNLAGIKYTHEDFMDFLSCLHFKDGKYDMLWGRDENLLSALALGAEGGVGSTYNYAAPLYLDLIAAYNAGDFTSARTLQQKSINMIYLLGKYGGISTGKAYMRYINFDLGGFRLPVGNMSDSAYADFCRDVKKLNMEDSLSKV
ncbi:MAG: dihydrodipicolinate synthase family protein [Bacteroidales bacterium]